MKWKKRLAAIISCISLVAFIVFLVNKFCCFFATMGNILQSKPSNTYNWRFGDISYTKTGSGCPVLLIHDLSVYSSSYEWNKVVDGLSKKNTVYCIDLLGCGKSEKPNLTYTNFLYVQLISDFIKQIIGEKTDIVSSGSSASIPIMTALYNSDLINNIIITNPTSIKDFAQSPSKRSKTLKYIISVPIIGTLFYNIFNNKKHLETLFDTEFFYNSDFIKKEDINAFCEASHLDKSNSKFLFGSIIGKYCNMNITPALSSINNSIILLVSKENVKFQDIATTYKDYMPSIEVISMGNSMKYPQLETPIQFIDQVNFLLEETKELS